ncbi:C-type mannose receptor 2 [Nymphon striatum]|nr:C-type mannose receptor 2 [Nymphon striatum]
MIIEKSAEVASFHSWEELKAVSTFFKTPENSLWIGLYVNSSDGIFRWKDESAIDFFNWETGGEEYSNNEKCVEMDKGSLKWKFEPCSIRNFVICSAPKIVEVKKKRQDLFKRARMTSFKNDIRHIQESDQV